MTIAFPQLVAFKAVFKSEYNIVEYSPPYDQLQKMYDEVVRSPGSRKSVVFITPFKLFTATIFR